MSTFFVNGPSSFAVRGRTYGGETDPATARAGRCAGRRRWPVAAVVAAAPRARRVAARRRGVDPREGGARAAPHRLGVGKRARPAAPASPGRGRTRARSRASPSRRAASTSTCSREPAGARSPSARATSTARRCPAPPATASSSRTATRTSPSCATCARTRRSTSRTRAAASRATACARSAIVDKSETRLLDPADSAAAHAHHLLAVRRGPARDGAALRGDRGPRLKLTLLHRNPIVTDAGLDSRAHEPLRRSRRIRRSHRHVARLPPPHREAAQDPREARTRTSRTRASTRRRAPPRSRSCATSRSRGRTTTRTRTATSSRSSRSASRIPDDAAAVPRAARAARGRPPPHGAVLGEAPQAPAGDRRRHREAARRGATCTPSASIYDVAHPGRGRRHPGSREALPVRGATWRRWGVRWRRGAASRFPPDAGSVPSPSRREGRG